MLRRCISFSFLKAAFLPTLARPIKPDPNKSKATGSGMAAFNPVKISIVAETLFTNSIKPTVISAKNKNIFFNCSAFFFNTAYFNNCGLNGTGDPLRMYKIAPKIWFH